MCLIISAFVVAGQKESGLSSLRSLQGLRQKNSGRAGERAGEQVECEDLPGKEEKEDAVSEVVRSVYRVA